LISFATEEFCGEINRELNGVRMFACINIVSTKSVPRSMHRIVTVPNGRGISKRMNRRKGEISGIFDVSV
jgi:hypothetical protein